MGQLLAQKYQVVVTNPPYRNVSDVNAKLADYIKTHYPDSKNDLFAVFMERCNGLLVDGGIQSMITQQSWMSLVSYKELRVKLQKILY